VLKGTPYLAEMATDAQILADCEPWHGDYPSGG